MTEPLPAREIARIERDPETGHTRVASGLSDFIRNATPEEKAEVYSEVMDAVRDQQKAVIDDGDYYSEEAADIAESKARNAGVKEGGRG